VLGGSCRPYKDLLGLRRNNAFIPATCFFALSATELLPRPHVTWSLKFHLPKYRAGEDVEKICPVSARDSLHRDFTACALGSGGES
jgi:hypothetical protein